MDKRYTIEEIDDILRANDIYTELRGRRKKDSPEQRPERIIDNIVGINIPLKAYHYQIRVCDELYNQIKTDSRLNINNSTNFPLLSFVDKNGALIQYNKMPLEMRQHFDSAYEKVEFLKKYKNHKEYIDELIANKIVYFIDHGAVERSNINKGRMNLIILFTAKDMDIIIDHIITYVNSKRII